MSNENQNPETPQAIPPEFQRYSKQIRFPRFGVEGQERLAKSRAVVVGCGALGSVIANLMTRAGVGELVLLDRDFVELDNLQRQTIYNESDVGMPKAKVAEQKLRAINSSISIEGRIVDVDHRNIERHLLEPSPAQIVLDGTDNFEVRFLINDTCVKHGIPWIYGGCLGAEGQVMSILPKDTGCLNCLMQDGPPPPGTTATCDSGGILSTIINVIASIQVNEAFKVLTENRQQVSRKLQVFDIWNNRNYAMDLSNIREKVDCPTCQNDKFVWLDGKRGSHSVVLCGRNAVQVSYPERSSMDLESLANRLAASGRVVANEFLVRLYVEDFVISTFEDGRAIINGTNDIVVAKKLYAQYIGA